MAKDFRRTSPLIHFIMAIIIRKREKACGIDVHKRKLVATMLSSNGESVTKEFSNDFSGVDPLRDWIIGESCDVVAFESTGIYWRFLYLNLKETVPIEVANAYQIKNIPGKKTDARDSEWIATLALNSQISPSRILDGVHEEFRSILRYRKKLVQDRTSVKNRIHKILDTENIKLARLFTDIFGKSGRIVLEAIIKGTDIDEVMATLPPRMRKKKEEINEILVSSISQADLIQLDSLINTLKCLDAEIKRMEANIALYAKELHEEEWNILCSVPGIGPLSASMILGEISDIHHFDKPEKLVSWAGLNPSVYQSAGVNHTGHITKQGDAYLRWIMTECATGCIKKKGTHLYAFFERVRNKVGYKKAIVALARKLLTLVWHLLTNNEKYEDPGYHTKGEVSIKGFLKLVKKIGTEEALRIIEAARMIDKDFNGFENGFAEGD